MESSTPRLDEVKRKLADAERREGRRHYREWHRSHGGGEYREPQNFKLELVDDDAAIIWLYDSIDTENTKNLIQELHAAEGRSVTVRINSSGGSAFDGIAIFNSLREHNGRIVTQVDGLAASAASLVFMAGDERRMHRSSRLMVHVANSVFWGTADGFEKRARELRETTARAAEIYAERSGLELDEVNRMLESETWLSAAKAKELNFATSIIAAKVETPILAESTAAWQLDAFQKTPQPVKQRLERAKALIASQLEREASLAKKRELAELENAVYQSQYRVSVKSKLRRAEQGLPPILSPEVARAREVRSRLDDMLIENRLRWVAEEPYRERIRTTLRNDLMTRHMRPPNPPEEKIRYDTVNGHPLVYRY